MTLNANALATVDEFLTLSGSRLQGAELLSVYRDSSGGATSATVTVTSTLLTLASNVEASTNLTLANYATITALVAAINSVSGWVAVAIKPNAVPTDLSAAVSQPCYLVANTVFLEGEDRGAIEAAINAASNMIEKYCGRTFAQTTYRRLYNGHGLKELSLGVFPVISISRIAIGLENVLLVKYNGLDAEAATVEVTSTGVTCTVIGGADDGSNTATFAANTTIGALQAALDAFTNWTCTLDKAIATSWSSAKLLAFSPRNALRRNTALYTPGDEVEEYDVQHNIGVLSLRGASNFMSGAYWGGASGYSFGQNQPPIYPLAPDKLAPFWPSGNHNIYIEFSANFVATPPDVADCCVELANNLMWAKRRDGGLASVTTDGLSQTLGDGPMSKSLQARLYPYRNLCASYSWVDV